MQGKWNGSRQVALSNRELYAHPRQANTVVSPSGLVTGFESVLRPCSTGRQAQTPLSRSRKNLHFLVAHFHSSHCIRKRIAKATQPHP
jgi:hypothetical protein